MPDVPPFPPMPPAPFELGDPQVALDAVKRVFAWRDDVRTWLASDPDVSPKMGATLYRLFAGSAEAGERTFPIATATNADPIAGLRRILVWRADILYWLADIPDVIGTPAYDDDDVARAQSVFGTRRRATDDVCSYCLGEIGDPRTHFNRCAAFRANGEAARAEALWGKPPSR
jgi:hypothetical protein